MNIPAIVYSDWKLAPDGSVYVERTKYSSMREAKTDLLRHGFYYCHSVTMEQDTTSGIRPRVFENEQGEHVFLATETDWDIFHEFWCNVELDDDESEVAV